MPCIDQICPECGYEWSASTMLKCGVCLMDRVKVVDGVRDTPAARLRLGKTLDGEDIVSEAEFLDGDR